MNAVDRMLLLNQCRTKNEIGPVAVNSRKSGQLSYTTSKMKPPSWCVAVLIALFIGWSGNLCFAQYYVYRSKALSDFERMNAPFSSTL